ncbi:MAG: hypothetical protein HUJ53_02485 [Holdemanella sp.]|nr:hypothetical protein [Holdemanella sp.]
MNKNKNGFFTLFASIAKHTSAIVDKILFGKKSAIFASFVFALMIVYPLNKEQIHLMINKEKLSISLNNVEVKVLADTEMYEITGVPNTVEVTISGEATEVQEYKQKGEHVVVCDLRSLDVGTTIVDLVLESPPENAEVKVNPGSATVILSKKETMEFPLEVQLLVGVNQKITDYKTPKLSQSTVEIIASKETLARIRVVKAIVDATGNTGEFETDAKIVAYDSDGNVLNVKISPNTIKATVKMASGGNE